jgi:hypothetical protein
MQQLYEGLLQTRTLLRSDANNLAARGLLNEASLRALSGETGYQNVAYDVLSLVSIHTSLGAKSAGRTTVSVSELQSAREDASQTLTLAAQREQQLKERSQLSDERRRAFSRLSYAYDEARRAVCFLEWREPSKQLPSLHSSRNTRKAQSDVSTDLPALGTPVAGVQASPQAAAPAAPAASPPGSLNSFDRASQASSAPAGSRGGNPFGAS